MAWKRENPAYDELYLGTTIKVTVYLFTELAKRDEYDIFSMIDVYMRYSEIRERMDCGNWSALNKSCKQLLNSIDYDLCAKRNNSEIIPDDIELEWMANIYVLFQWAYNVPSAFISENLDAKKLYGLFNPLHEMSYKNACERICFVHFSGQIVEPVINDFRGEYAFLSNFYEAPVVYGGIQFQNNEAAFQAQKCVDAEERKQFSNLNPSEAKQLGRKVVLRKDWESVKIPIMKEIVKAKFEQNPELQKNLLNTKDAFLEEGNNWGDRIWGTVDGKGANNLGRILMEVRTELTKKEKTMETKPRRR